MGVNHPFSYRGHYNHRGEICHCPWGGGKHRDERLGSIREASKLDWLMDRPDMQTPEGQQFLNFVQGKGVKGDEVLSPYSGPVHADADKMLPWLAREWKKGRIHLPESPMDYRMYYHPDQDGIKKYLNGGTLVGIQDALEEMKKRKQGVDIMQHKVHELMPKVQEFRDWKKTQERQNLGEVLHRFKDGWTVRRLQDEDEHRDEGELMGHCVGDPSMPYIKRTDDGSSIYASLRDHKNLPHATMELTPDHWDDYDKPRVGPSSEVEQFFGKEDQPPLEEYQDRMNEWLAPHGVKAGDGFDEEWAAPGATDVEEYNESADGGYMEWAHQDPEANLGEDTEIYQEPHNYHSIANDFLNPLTPDDMREELFNNARQQAWDFEDVERALYSNMDDDPEHHRIMNQWERWKNPWYHPYTGEFQTGTINPPIDQFQNRLFNERPTYQQEPKQVVPRYQYDTDNLGAGVTDTGPVQGPWQSPHIPWTQNPNLASTTKPFYYRWVFSPTKGVTLGSNGDEHPALVPYHQGLGGQVDSQDLMHGYAYRIKNGWRLTDWEHRPLEDPFIVAQVVRSLELKESPEKQVEGSWRPIREENWDRLHYGLPATELA